MAYSTYSTYVHTLHYTHIAWRPVCECVSVRSPSFYALKHSVKSNKHTLCVHICTHAYKLWVIVRHLDFVDTIQERLMDYPRTGPSWHVVLCFRMYDAVWLFPRFSFIARIIYWLSHPSQHKMWDVTLIWQRGSVFGGIVAPTYLTKIVHIYQSTIIWPVPMPAIPVRWMLTETWGTEDQHITSHPGSHSYCNSTNTTAKRPRARPVSKTAWCSGSIASCVPSPSFRFFCTLRTALSWQFDAWIAHGNCVKFRCVHAWHKYVS